MKRFTLLLTSALLFVFEIDAQKLYPKLDAFTQRSIQQAGDNKKNIHLFVKGNSEKIKEAVLAVKGKFKYGYNGINSVEIPISRLAFFLKSDAIKGVENGEVPMVPLLDQAIINNCVLPVHLGDTPLDTSYKGDGVVLGIIDYGIDFDHEDFKKPNGETRIRYIWDQNILNGPADLRPQPYDYGRECNQYDVDAGQCPHEEEYLTQGYGHGTSVAGIAAGDGSACNGLYTGMAPNSELIVVAFNWQRPFLNTFIDAVDYIFKKADAMEKPCVVNASLGTYHGSRDGKDFASQIIDGLLEERNGRVLVAATGNAGHIDYHVGYEVTNDSSFTWFKKNNAENDVAFEVWADTADFNNVWFAFSADDHTNWQSKGISHFLNVLKDYKLSDEDSTGAYNFEINVGSQTPQIPIKTTVTRSEGRYSLQVVIDKPPSDFYWRFITTGSGKIDIWSDKGLMNTSDIVKNNLPSDSILPEIIYYKGPNKEQTIVSSYTTSDKVIAVGNYENRENHYFVDSCFHNLGVKAGTLAESSSQGPTRDGRIKPDIAATGSSTIAAGNSGQIALSYNPSNPCNSPKVGLCGKYWRNGGTSMASPIVAGVAALYLQKNPNASYREVKDAIILSAKQDTFTEMLPYGSTPNNSFGYGKVCGFEALQMDLHYGCTDTAAENYDPNANMDNGSCVYDTAIYGCMDTAALNYDPVATVDTGGCVYETTGIGIENIYSSNSSILFYPNPFNEDTRIVYSIDPSMAREAQIIITNLLGQKVDAILLENAEGKIDYNFPNKNKGVYLYHLLFNDKVVLTDKVVRY